MRVMMTLGTSTCRNPIHDIATTSTSNSKTVITNNRLLQSSTAVHVL